MSQENSKRRSPNLNDWIIEETDRLAAKPNANNDHVNKASFNIGRVIGGAAAAGLDVMNSSIAEQQVFVAAQRAGVQQRRLKKRGSDDTGDTIRRAIAAGQEKPRDLTKYSGNTGRSSKPEPPKASNPNLKFATRIISESEPIRDSPAEKYLRERGIVISNENLRHSLDRALRFHPNCPVKGVGKTTTMIASVANARTGEFMAVQRTAITQKGVKWIRQVAAKQSLGRHKGGAVYFKPSDTCDTLYETEGIEDALTPLVASVDSNCGAIATLGDGSLGKPHLPEHKKLVIIGDRLDDGNPCPKARRAAHKRAEETGKTVGLVYAREGCKDLNDMLVSDGREAVTAQLANAEQIWPDLAVRLKPRPRSNDYIVKNLLSRGQTAVLYGPSGCGKTVVAVDLAWHIAKGLPYCERRTREANVVYVAYEDPAGVDKRLCGLMSPDDAHFPFAILEPSLRLTGADREQAAAEIIDATKGYDRVSNRRTDLIVIDTYHQAIGGGDEDSSAIVGETLAVLNKVTRATGAAVMLLHHPGKDKSKGMRGSSALYAASDVVLKVDCDDTTTVTAKPATLVVEKNKDGSTGEPLFDYMLKPIELGADEEGDPITTVVLDALGKPGTGLSQPPKGQGAALLRVLKTMISEGKTEAPCSNCNVPKEVCQVVNHKHFVERCLADDAIGHGGNKHARSNRVSSVLGRLIKTECIGRYKDHLWLLIDPDDN